MTAVHLICIDPARDMRRFYRLDVEPDLLGGFAVVEEWERIGARGRMVGEWYTTKALASAALEKPAERKRRRAYAPSCARNL